MQTCWKFESNMITLSAKKNENRLDKECEAVCVKTFNKILSSAAAL